MKAHLRVARPVRDLTLSAAMYRRGLGLQEIDRFDDHDGIDGVMLGSYGAGYHLEFTYCRNRPVPPTPTHEDLLVFYVPEADAWQSICCAMLEAGFKEVEPCNPFWKRRGRSFEDPDGYRVVIQQAAWSNGRS